MGNQDPTLADLLKEALHDAQDLVRSELALARAEMREEARRLSQGVGLLTAAALAGAIAVVFLLTAIAWAISERFLWPVWSGFAIVTFFMLITAGALGVLGWSWLRADRHMPRSVDAMKENAKWVRARTS
jgi:hypothetical protein